MELAKYSIVIPVYNEEESIPDLVKHLREVIDLLDGPVEVLLVDDGSKDGGYRLMVAANAQDPRFKVLRLSRNFGHQVAITAGMDYASGQAVVVMDADLQDPPMVILQMAKRWQEGYEVVYAVRQRREGETFGKKATARLYYGLLRKLADVDQQVDVGDFRLADRKAVDAFLRMRERDRYVRGMFCWIGFSQIAVPYIRESRRAGRSKYRLAKMLKLASDGIIGFSNAPLRLGITAGLVMAVAALGYGLAAIGLKLAGLPNVPGYASLLVTITFLSGVQLIVVGIIGQYLARVFDEVRGRPLYLVRESLGLRSAGLPSHDHGERVPEKPSA
ncbi:MAG TPA: glycosyltransferase family 2 protein [Streptosporangiaceae bacterium]|nr:glycosyltransferase family 2 protein [Streptosporangiaceae bacterium]